MKRSLILPYRLSPSEEYAMVWWCLKYRRSLPRIYTTKNICSTAHHLKDDLAWYDLDYRSIFLSEKFFKLEIDQRILVLFHECAHYLGVRSEKKADIIAGSDFFKLRTQ